MNQLSNQMGDMSMAGAVKNTRAKRVYPNGGIQSPALNGPPGVGNSGYGAGNPQGLGLTAQQGMPQNGQMNSSINGGMVPGYQQGGVAGARGPVPMPMPGQPGMAAHGVQGQMNYAGGPGPVRPLGMGQQPQQAPSYQSGGQPAGANPSSGFQSGPQQPPKPRIDPDQIPSPVKEREKDQIEYIGTAFPTSSRTLPPLPTTYFRAIDEGNCLPKFMRSTLYSVPVAGDLLSTCSVPFGVVIQPLADLSPEEAPIPVVDFGKPGPVRCSRCQAYVNPYFQFVNGGRLFVCNLCSFSNEVPQEYICNLDMSGRRMDTQQRPELMYGSVEFEVGEQYYIKPPVPASYLFAIDVSVRAIQSGMVATFAASLKHFLFARENALPIGARVGIITYDRAIHFYNLNVSF
jgi:protein transport protein SEC24